jgi:SPP1 gp7 family putative phage head morphogenesis protein
MCLKCRLVNLSIDLNDLEPELRRIAQLLYTGNLKPGQIDEAMVKRIAAELMKAISNGFNTKNESIISFIQKIEENIYVFSGFKNYQQLKETSLLLLDNEGSFKSFNQFYEAVKQINETYNSVYLESEYNNALSSAQNAQSWLDYTENGIDMLMFQDANDDRVRDDHAAMSGTIVSIDDPILDTYYTPLDWGCRCEWVPAAGAKPTGYIKSELPKVPEMFQNNVGKTGIVFPDTHPYFNVDTQTGEIIRDQVNDILKQI